MFFAIILNPKFSTLSLVQRRGDGLAVIANHKLCGLTASQIEQRAYQVVDVPGESHLSGAGYLRACFHPAIRWMPQSEMPAARSGVVVKN